MFLKKYNFYIKNFSLFMIVEMFIVLVVSLMNLMGISPSITSLIIFILNVLLFITTGFLHGKITNKKGYITGFLTGGFLSFLMFLINIIFFKGDFNFNLIFYYFILISASTLGSMVGKAKKIEAN